MAEHASARLTRAEGRKFAFTVGAAFLLIAAVVWWRRGPVPGAFVPGVLGACLVVAGLFFPAHLTLVHQAWMGLAALISRVTTPIVMAVIYFVVITPIGILRRTIGRNPLDHEPNPDSSYWGSAEPPRGDLERQF